jgi:outer membrane protein assembly factor BamB
MKDAFRFLSTLCIAAIVLALTVTCPSEAVTSKITRQTTDKEFRNGKTEDVVVVSPGTIQLGRASKVLSSEFKGVWSVNSIVVSGGTVYIGTSPNGSIYQYRLGALTKIYPADSNTAPDEVRPSPAPLSEDKEEAAEPSEQAEEDEGVVKAKEQLSNEHIFTMAVDVAGRLLVGFSGKHCRLCRYETGRMETIFEPNDARYIFAIEPDDVGNVYLGTGPEGKVYALDPSGNVAQLIYDVPDKNILSLRAGKDGLLYAGVDGRGLIYKIDPRTKTATVLYDSEEPEISGLTFLDGATSETGDLYAAATSAKVVQAERAFAATQPAASGRPEPKTSGEESVSQGDGDGGMRLQIPNSKKEPEKPSPSHPRPSAPSRRDTATSHLYKVTRQGYVTDVFSESAVFLGVAAQRGAVLIGTGDDGQLFSVDPDAERATVLYKDEEAAQITAVTVSGREIYVGTGNPARLVLLSPDYAAEGTYISDLVDAEQPAKWGKLQIDADVPKGCQVLVASRSGNVEDVNDPSFSPWTEPVEITEPVQLGCPLGRFCQYKLMLRTQDAAKTPVIREVAVASTVPNLAPKVESVDVSRREGSGKEGILKIAIKANDENEDKLIYHIDFRKLGRERWIELEDKVEEDTFDWDSRTVEDGRYEIRITADDERSNSPTTRLTGTRISDPVVVDNTGPVIRKYSLEKSAKTASLKLSVSDELSVIGKLDYTVDSNDAWKSVLPDDLVFDTTDESFAIVTDELKPGDHIIALRIADDVGNTTYKTYEFMLSEQ